MRVDLGENDLIKECFDLIPLSLCVYTLKGQLGSRTVSSSL